MRDADLHRLFEPRPNEHRIILRRDPRDDDDVAPVKDVEAFRRKPSRDWEQRSKPRRRR